MSTRTFLQGAADNSNLTTYTFSSQNLGTADGARLIICGIASRAGGSSTISSVTIGGVSATIVVQINTSADSGWNSAGIVIAAVPTGTTGDVVITFSAGQARCAIALYSTIDTASETASDTDSNAAADPSVSIDCPASGYIIAVACFSVGTGTTTWTGVTEDYDVNPENVANTTMASDNFASAQTGLTVSANSTLANGTMVVASWGPAGGGGGNRRRRSLLCGSAA